MPSSRPLPVLLLVAACAPRVLVFPGPSGVVGRDARPALVSLPAPEEPRGQGTSEGGLTRPSALGARIERAASHYLRQPPPASFRRDCSGFVCAVLDRAGVQARGNTAGLWELAERLEAVHHRAVPWPGDLVFFDHTYDRDGNGKVDDPLTHIGVVLSVDEGGTATVAHISSSKGRTTLRVNAARPDEHADDAGVVLNSYLRRRTSRDGPKVRYLAGELLRGFATVRAEDLELWAED